MKMQKGAPSKSDKFYLKKGYGGYNPCVLGNPKHRYCKGSVLVNCVGYCTGRYNFTSGEKTCRWLGNTDAERYINLAKKQGLAISEEPTVGGVMVWKKGKILHSDGAGHVAFVEKIKDGTVTTSESGWGYTKSYVTNKTRKKGKGNWGQGSAYTYLGCIVNPNIDPYEKPARILKKGMKGEDVKWMQWAINRAGVKCDIDGSFGAKTETALKSAQKIWGLSPDGSCGMLTQTKIRELYAIE